MLHLHVKEVLCKINAQRKVLHILELINNKLLLMRKLNEL